jgi:hypothetical protein
MSAGPYIFNASSLHSIPVKFHTHKHTHIYMSRAVAQLVEILCYKPEGRGFDSR